MNTTRITIPVETDLKVHAACTVGSGVFVRVGKFTLPVAHLVMYFHQMGLVVELFITRMITDIRVLI